jgi:predicted porin
MRSASILLLSGVLAVCCAPPALAQAWLPPKGEASFSLGYGNVFVNRHYLGTADNPGDNVESDYGHIRSQSFGMGFTYGVTNRFAVSLGLPFIVTKYYGTAGQNFFPHTIPIDDGDYHGTFQDYRFALAYQAFNGPLAVTPFVAAVIPSHGYTTFAHAAPGRDLREYLLGASVGGRLDPLLTDSYFEATYSYAFVERLMNIHHDRSDASLELGYFLTPSLAMRVIGTGHYTHGGVAFQSPQTTPPDLFPIHDQIDKSSAINVGTGLSYTLSGSTTLYASYLTQVQGRGGHKINDALGFGVSYSFSPAQVARRIFPPKSPGLPVGTP